MKRASRTIPSRAACRSAAAVGAAVLAVAAAGCRSPAVGLQPERGVRRPLWPAPPAKPRIEYICSIMTPADVGIRLPAWRGLVAILTGSRRGREALVKPFGVAVDEAGGLCVADSGAGAVCFFDAAHGVYRRWERIGKNRFVSPVAVAKKGETFFVADPGLGKIVVFDGSGKWLFDIEDDFRRPVGLAISGESLFVAYARSHCVAVYDLKGRLMTAFGGRGEAPGKVNYPTHVAVDKRGWAYVTDSMNSRVQVFDPAGRFSGVVGSLGDSSGHFSRPKGVALDREGNLYAVDALFDNIQVFNSDGRLLLYWGEEGSGPGEFWLPAGIAIDGEQRIYVADSYNRRVQVFKRVGPAD